LVQISRLAWVCLFLASVAQAAQAAFIVDASTSYVESVDLRNRVELVDGVPVPIPRDPTQYFAISGELEIALGSTPILGDPTITVLGWDLTYDPLPYGPILFPEITDLGMDGVGFPTTSTYSYCCGVTGTPNDLTAPYFSGTFDGSLFHIEGRAPHPSYDLEYYFVINATTSAIPEPATGTLLGMGLLCAAFPRRRSMRAQAQSMQRTASGTASSRAGAMASPQASQVP